jgi:hypothetical protein
MIGMRERSREEQEEKDRLFTRLLPSGDRGETHAQAPGLANPLHNRDRMFRWRTFIRLVFEFVYAATARHAHFVLRCHKRSRYNGIKLSLILFGLFLPTCFGQILPSETSETSHLWTARNSMCKLNGAMYVGGFCSAVWGGSDIGAQIDAAYAALSPSGGSIYILPPVSDGCYSFTTPIEFTRAGEYAILSGVASSNQEPSGGACLNYIPTTAGAAIILDYTPKTGGGYGAAGGLLDLTLVNASCFTNGGCGSSATGVLFGTDNTGAQMAELRNVRINGFGTGIALSDRLGGSWGLQLENLSLDWNTTGLALTWAHENIHWFGGSCSVNGTCVDGGATTSDLYFYGVSIDENTSAGILSSGWGINFHCFGCHFEGKGNSSTNFLNVSGGTTMLVGGLFLDDTHSGTAAQMFSVSGGMIAVDGASMFSEGRTINSLFNLSNGAVIAGKYFTAAPNQIHDSCSTPNGCLVQKITSAGNAGVAAMGFEEQMTAPAAPPGYDYCYGDSNTHAIECSYNGDAMSSLVRSSDLAAGTLTTKLTNVTVVSSPPPNCSAGTAGVINYSAGLPGVKDTLQVCAKDAKNDYAWRTIY